MEVWRIRQLRHTWSLTLTRVPVARPDNRRGNWSRNPLTPFPVKEGGTENFSW